MSDLGNVESVGAKLVLLNGPAFRAGLQAATEAVDAFTEAQEKAAEAAKETAATISKSTKTSTDATKESATASTEAIKTQAEQTVAAADTIAEAHARAAEAAEVSAEKQDAAAAAAAAAQRKVRAASVAGTTEMNKGWTNLVGGSEKILKWGSIIGGVVTYEGVKKYMAFNNQITQLAVNAGVAKSQLGAFSTAALKVSDNTGIAATNVADMFYRIASANPNIKATVASLAAMGQQAANLAVMTGNPNANYDSVARLYGAVVSNQLSVGGGKPLTYSTASGAAINAWANATVGRGDVKPGDFVAAMGTGVLPMLKTAGLDLNQFGAMFDVLSPGMGAQSASTRLKTAISMMASPTASSREAYELFGANATTPGSIMRSKGPTAMLNYLATMLTGKVTGKTFANAFYGSGLGSITGGTKGVGTGASEYLRVMGFTPAQVKTMETQGPGAFAKMTLAQLAAQGFAKGTTGAIAEKTVKTDFLSQMFGGGREGATVMQLLNERGTLASKQKAIVAAENPAAYSSALKLAFSTPTVQMAKFGTSIDNLTIAIGQGLTPTVVAFSKDLLTVGQWFGKNRWALEAALGVAGTVYGVAGVVKAVSITEKIASGVKYLFTGASTASLGTAGTTLTSAGVNLNLAADKLMGGSHIPGVNGPSVTKTAETDAEHWGFLGTPAGALLTTVGGIGASAAAMYGIYKGANYLSRLFTGVGKFARGITQGSSPVPWDKLIHLPGAGSAGVDWSGGVALGAPPKLSGQAARAWNLAGYLTARGQTLPGRLRAQLTPSEMGQLSAFQSMPAGVSIPGAVGTHSLFTKTWAPASSAATRDWRHYLSGLSPQNRTAAWSGLSALSPAAQAARLNAGVSNGGAYGVVPLGPAIPVGTRVASMTQPAGGSAPGMATSITAAGRDSGAPQLIEAASHISDAAMKYSAELAKMMSADSQQQTAANTQQTAANTLNNAANNLVSASVKLDAAAANAAASLTPGNIYKLNTAGARKVIARK